MKKNILIIGPYLPGKEYGGPVKSLLNLVERLSDDYNFYVITNDRDLNAVKPYTDVQIGSWNTVGKAKVYYIPQGKEFSSVKSLLKEQDFDLIYISSFFSKLSVFVLWLKRLNYTKEPVIVAPRGEFSKGALSIKTDKKKLYINIFKFINLHKKITFTCTSNSDKQDIINLFGSQVKVNIAGNIVNSDIDPFTYPINKKSGQLRIATVSRISRIKNLDFSLQILREVDKSDQKFNEIVFDIYGPLEDKEYWKECLIISEDLSDRVKVNYKGALSYTEVPKVLSLYHTFLFPTKGENFGHVIQESLLSGCPVITSDQTPWKNLNELGIGFDIPLDMQFKFIDAISHYLYMDNDNYKLVSKKAYEYGKYKVDNQLALKEHINMFNNVLR
ncbi:glycosyltransferase family 4 protein [Bacillus sp. NTK034]|uniref:glycosyltransferase family 4 protein n=1 Tax=Bacillus sp. NTK034 TaxID=2802176 RepID=UPI001A8C050C|nr:glycosyltransferase family 4 protein [Bacillus sp. NTK034]MBN8201818.1 glycosyltransferase family 4 protein [Bacillus sp. NTK034]